MLSIGDISENVPVVTLKTKSSDVNIIFEEQPNLEGIVVAKDNKPIGLVMKAQFYKKISVKYGFDLFMGRPIELVMDTKPLLVDYFDPITKVSSLAMDREQANLYDYVVVTKNGNLQGIVSIKNLLIKLAEEQVNQAMYTNPLSGLPGNVLIEEKISEYLINRDREFSLLYIDLDHFKEYNDTYGFKKGDLLLKEISNLLSKNVLLNNYDSSFVGHIGGDDFVAILPHFYYQQISQLLITEFDIRLKQYYNEIDWKNKFVYTKSRNGQFSNVPLVSLSIAVVTNKQNVFHSIEDISKIAAEVKTKCKEIDGSCYICY
ncbi:diguanylate cyclase (GGDEF)-like protein [Metabacillus crassostreae]|uniref:GGDEF domain-containing protein n=1 Tax=Metabacillus crassostreae TaxID=929098 RepID=UPI00195AF5E2|nr:GGDEF domain-containing protein [Metabacillus crassostreae]MBM7603590.1 diguanylate cyclase (GGDEF)-like protein [Metabacillus crassostreae]